MERKDEIVLNIECDLKSFYCKRRFSIFQWTQGDLRVFVEQLLDIPLENLILLLQSNELTLERDDDLLGQIEDLREDSTIVVKSHRPADDIDDVNRLPEKYQMSDVAYAQRKGTLRDYLQVNKLGKYSDEHRSDTSSVCKTRRERRTLNDINRWKLKEMSIGMHVKVNEPISITRFGQIAFIGTLRGIYGDFLGIVFNGPWGDSNGCYGTARYFDAMRKHASFVRPEYVEIVPRPSDHLGREECLAALPLARNVSL